MTRNTGTTSTPSTPSAVESHFSVPIDVPEHLVTIGEELARLEESARWSSQGQFEAAKAWQRWNFRLGVPAAALGLLSGGAAYTEALPGWVVGTGALAGAALATTLTVLSAERRAQRAKTCANTFHDIQDDARRTLLIDLAGMDRDEARTALDALTERYSETRQAADAPTEKYYARAGVNIRSGGQQFAIDAEKARPSAGTAPTPHASPVQPSAAVAPTPATDLFPIPRSQITKEN